MLPRIYATKSVLVMRAKHWNVSADVGVQLYGVQFNRAVVSETQFYIFFGIEIINQIFTIFLQF